MQVSMSTKRLQDLLENCFVRIRNSGYYTELEKVGVGYVPTYIESYFSFLNDFFYDTAEFD